MDSSKLTGKVNGTQNSVINDKVDGKGDAKGDAKVDGESKEAGHGISANESYLSQQSVLNKTGLQSRKAAESGVLNALRDARKAKQVEAKKVTMNMDTSGFMSTKSLNSSTREPTSFNVGLGDRIAIPLYSETAQSVIIRWTQGNEVKELGRWLKASSMPSHTAAYTVMYGYNVTPDRVGREVLIFIATEFISPAYTFHPLHLDHVSVPMTAEVQESHATSPFRCIHISPMWQYGTRGAHELFIVYHPLHRKPFQGRFMTAIGSNPTALNGSVIESDVKIQQPGVKTGTTIDTPLGDLTIPSSVTMVAGKQALATASGLWSSFKGDPLKTFNDENILEAPDLTSEQIAQVDKKAGALDAFRAWRHRDRAEVYPAAVAGDG